VALYLLSLLFQLKYEPVTINLKEFASANSLFLAFPLINAEQIYFCRLFRSLELQNLIKCKAFTGFCQEKSKKDIFTRKKDSFSRILSFTNPLYNRN
jgi:hypothetical protein